MSTFVDTHHHWVPSTLATHVERVAGDNMMAGMIKQIGGSLPGLFDIERQIEDLGDGVAVLSLLPEIGAVATGADVAALSTASNDELIAAVAERDAFARALITLPLPDVDAALAELARVGDRSQVGGVMIHTVATEWTVDEARFEPVYAEIARRGLPLMLHPAAEPPPLALRDFRLADSLGAMFSSTAGAARFMLSGMLDRVGDLIVIVPHLGGTLPYLAQRLVDQNGRGDAEHDILEYLQTRIWLDSCSYHPPALKCALETVSRDRVLLGSDYPFRGSVARAVEDVDGSDGILRDNVERMWALRKNVT